MTVEIRGPRELNVVVLINIHIAELPFHVYMNTHRLILFSALIREASFCSGKQLLLRF